MFILVKSLLYTTMPKLLTEAQKKERSRRRREQRERAALRKMAEEPVFYQPHILNVSVPQQCSVCGIETLSINGNFASIALCSTGCVGSYTAQFTQFGLDLTKGSIIIYNGRRYKYDTNMLVKNSVGEVCIEAWDSRGSFRDSKVLIPFSQRHEILQLLH